MATPTDSLSSSLRREFADVERQLEEATRMSDSIHSAEFSYRGSSLVETVSRNAIDRASIPTQVKGMAGHNEATSASVAAERPIGVTNGSLSPSRESTNNSKGSRRHYISGIVRREGSRNSKKRGGGTNQSNSNINSSSNHANNNSTHSISIARRPHLRKNNDNVKLDPHDLTFCRYRKRVTIACDDELFMREANMNNIRLSIGLYKGYPLAQSMLNGATIREKILKEHGVKQTDHIKGTDGWIKSMVKIFRVWLLLLV